MNIFKRLYSWAKGVFEDIKEGYIDTSEIEPIFMIFLAILFIFMVLFYANLDTSGAIYKL
jgi:hypothetical protein|tara:strand:+ start:34 stop:213 length:180 start_codon:yes stop_codon:yes gene_type:complete